MYFRHVSKNTNKEMHHHSDRTVDDAFLYLFSSSESLVSYELIDLLFLAKKDMQGFVYWAHFF